MACDIELHIPVTTDGDQAVELISQQCELSKGRIKQVMQCGAVWITRQQNTRRLRRAKASLQTGDEIHMYYDANTIDSVPPAPTLIADEGDYSVWYKSCGMYTQGTKWGDHHTVGRYAEQNLKPERSAKIVHRLDRHTSGLILLAHTKQAASLLSELFRDRKVEKHYWAVVNGKFGELNSRSTITDPVDDKHATSHVAVVGLSDSYSLLDVEIETGRKHQVRLHLSENGFPIVGDRMFGGEAGPDLQLCSVLLKFVCPISGEQRLYQTPIDMRPSI
jgi:tRNA pseudouridine32 synthase/23S rRNA pseudouridine746 synthase